ncbi:MAG: CbtA family protein [Stellaceae bacterium]
MLGRSSWRTAGVVPIPRPHLVGAPAAPPAPSDVPPDLVANFVASPLIACAFFWLVLGGVCGWVYEGPEGTRTPLLGRGGSAH